VKSVPRRATDKGASTIAAPDATVTTGTTKQSRDEAKSFFAQAPAHIEAIRTQLQTLSYTGIDSKGPDHLGDLYVSMHWLTTEAVRAELRAAARLSSTLQGLLKKLLENRKNVTASTLSAATDAVDVLEALCVKSKNPDLVHPEISILVVDDDPIARRAISGAIQLAFPKPESADTGEEAMAKASEKAFDAIFLDVQMPGMDGFVTCAKIHETALNARTPVVFVTSHTDIASREKAAQAGGSGFIPKPALAVEITLRALTLVLRGRLARADSSASTRELAVAAA
jgi:CheY-like chemotaxis protein